jgi:phage-related protein
MNSSHAISNIQAHLSADNKWINQEYSTINKEEKVCESAQETLNILCDYNRKKYHELPLDKVETDRILIDEVSSINIGVYLKRNNRVFMQCMANTLMKNGIDTLGELIQSYEYEMESRSLKTMKLVLTTFSTKLKDIAKCFVEGLNSSAEPTRFILLENDEWKDIKTITVKEFQVLLKKAMNKVETLNVNDKLGIDNFTEETITNVRKNCTNPKQRNIFFRLIHNDFYTHQKMKKFKMTNSDACPRCGETEDLKHLIWDCSHSKSIWLITNQILDDANTTNADKVIKYEDIFRACEQPSANIIKMKIIQEMIQIDRPKNWDKTKVIESIKTIMNIEKYNSIKYKQESKFYNKWKQFLKL